MWNGWCTGQKEEEVAVEEEEEDDAAPLVVAVELLLVSTTCRYSLRLNVDPVCISSSSSVAG